MSVTMYVIGGLAGLAFGSLVAFFNSRITKHYIEKNKDKAGPEGTAAVMGTNVVRMIVNIAAMALVFLTRKLVPLPFTATIIGTAAGLTLVSFFFLWKLSKNYD